MEKWKAPVVRCVDGWFSASKQANTYIHTTSNIKSDLHTPPLVFFFKKLNMGFSGVRDSLFFIVESPGNKRWLVGLVSKRKWRIGLFLLSSFLRFFL